MIKKYFIGSADVNNFQLKYYVYGGNQINEFTNFYEWGIRVEKIVSGKINESEEIGNISPDFKRVSEIAGLLKRNTVTPSGLLYAIEDITSMTL